MNLRPDDKGTDSQGPQAWREELSAALTASRLRFDERLGGSITLRIGGPADCLVDLESEADLVAALDIARRHGLPCHVLGKGSNVLVRDEGLRGLVLRFGAAFRQVRAGTEPGTVVAGAGLANAAFVEACRAMGLGGMEFLVAVPGTLGGAIAMNAGAHGGETADFLTHVRYLEQGRYLERGRNPARGGPDSAGSLEASPGVVEAPASAFEFAYRHSPLRANVGRMVLSGVFRLEPMEDVAMRERQREITQWRRENQPREYPNCGSVFKNPPGQFAARLIDEAGLKGHRLGGAQVSEKHANFIVNRGDATATDVLALVDFISQTVYARTGTRLELEMQVFPLH